MHLQCRTLATIVIEVKNKNRQYSTLIIINFIKQFCGFNHMHEMKQVEIESDCHGRKLRANSMFQQPLHQLYLISSCDSTAIAFKQDELCFLVLFCYQKSSESGETAVVSCKNCHKFRMQYTYKNSFILFVWCAGISSFLRIFGNTHTQ